jgi:hypothetical protein
MKKVIIFPSIKLLNSFVEANRSIMKKSAIIIEDIISFGDPLLAGNKASVEVKTKEKFGYFSLWSHGEFQASVIDELSLKEIYAKDIQVHNALDLENEFDKWIKSF